MLLICLLLIYLNCRGDEWSLRALASMPSIGEHAEHWRACRALASMPSIGENAEHCDFFASTSRDKKFALRAASNLENTTHEQRAFLIFSTCSNPYGNPFLHINNVIYKRTSYIQNKHHVNFHYYILV